MADRTSRVSFVQSLDPFCGTAPKGYVILGCTTANGHIFMPNPCPMGQYEEYAKILCHEMGHANGWPATHGA